MIAPGNHNFERFAALCNTPGEAKGQLQKPVPLNSLLSSIHSERLRRLGRLPDTRLYFAPYSTTRRGVIQASECKQNAAQADFRRAAWVYFTFLAFAATAFASAIISRC